MRRVRIRVRVAPGERRERFREVRAGVFEAAVREKAERGEANARVRRLIALHFSVPLTHVQFVSGSRSTTKVLEVVY